MRQQSRTFLPKCVSGSGARWLPACVSPLKDSWQTVTQIRGGMRARRGNEVRREFLGNDGNKSNVTSPERGRRRCRRLSSQGPAAHRNITCPACRGVSACNVGRRRPRWLLLVPAASCLTQNSASSCGDPITCHSQFAGKRPTLLNDDCEHKQEGTENIRGSNALPCGGLFLPNISRQSLGPTDRADICRQKKKQ